MTDEREVKPTGEDWERAVEKVLAYRRSFGVWDSEDDRDLSVLEIFVDDIQAEARRIAGERLDTDTQSA